MEDALQVHYPLTTNIVRNIDRASHKLLLKLTINITSKTIHMTNEDVKHLKKSKQDLETIDKDDAVGLTNVLDDFEEIAKTLNDDIDLDLSDNELDINDGSPFIDRAKSFNVEELFRGKINNELNDISSKNISNDISDMIRKAFKGKDKVKKATNNVNNLIATNNEDTSSTFRDAEEVLKANINELPPGFTFNNTSISNNDFNDANSNLVDTFNNFILDHGYFDEKFLVETGDTEFIRKHVISKKIDEDSLLREIIPKITKSDKQIGLKETGNVIKNQNLKMKPVKNLSKLKEINKSKRNTSKNIVTESKSKQNDKVFKIEDESTSNDNPPHSAIFTKPELPIDDQKTELSQDFIKFGADYNFRIFELSKEEQLEELQQRREGVLYVNAPYKCVSCAKGFKTMATYSNHLKIHEPSYGPFSCDICLSRHKSEARRRRHAATHRLKYCCTRCEVVARSRERAEAHFQWHAGKTFPCQYCGEQFGKASTHLSHIRLHHPDACVWCSLCGEAFVGALGLQQHTRRRHATETKEQSESNCFTCRVQFHNQEALLRHRAVAGNCSGLRSCTLCGDNFESELALSEHRRTHTGAPVQCLVCSSWFSSAQSCDTHAARAHLGARPPAPRPLPRLRPRPPPTSRPTKHAMCELCGKKYHSAAALSYHQRSHTGEKPYACTRCPKSFALNHSLQAHIRTHTGERPYRCPRCPRAFLNANNLARHKKNVHLGQRQYSRCAVCRRWLSSPSAAARHAATAHGQPALRKHKLQ